MISKTLDLNPCAVYTLTLCQRKSVINHMTFCYQLIFTISVNMNHSALSKKTKSVKSILPAYIGYTDTIGEKYLTNMALALSPLEFHQ